MCCMVSRYRPLPASNGDRAGSAMGFNAFSSCARERARDMKPCKNELCENAGGGLRYAAGLKIHAFGKVHMININMLQKKHVLP